MKQFVKTQGVLILFTFVTLVAVLSISSTVYLYTKYQSTVAQLKKNTGNSTPEIEILVNQIGSVMELPHDEVPTLATVTDTNKLPGIPFFAHAAVGDKVLIYQKASKAILYRPTTKKIIDTSVFSTQLASNSTSQSAKNTMVTIELRNGTSVPGLTDTIAKKIENSIPNSTVVSKTGAKRKTFTDSIVIAKQRSLESIASDIAKRLDMAVGPLPDKEASISSDIVIILGSDTIRSSN